MVLTKNVAIYELTVVTLKIESWEKQCMERSSRCTKSTFTLTRVGTLFM